MKNYYQILNISSNASQQEIKKAFRKLALKFHPDKNNNNKLAEEKFKEIQEAYSVLSNHLKRREYDQAKERTTIFTPPKPAVTLTTILTQTQRLSKKVASFDSNRLNQQWVYHAVDKLLSSINLLVIKEAGDVSSSRVIIAEVLRICEHLNFLLAENLASKLRQLAESDPQSQSDIQRFLEHKQRSSYWEKYKLLFAVIISLLLCLLIYVVTTSSHG
ncbi:J domain-containing protein [Segetibacter sp. 3557_3]|nr:J domain-containing protein [Segetibacter sp. 3557_3]